MAKDYFQDIVPPAGSRKARTTTARKITPKVRIEEDDEPLQSPPLHHEEEREAEQDIVDAHEDDLRQEVGLRGIRNVNIPARARTPRSVPDMHAPPAALIGTGTLYPSVHTSSSRMWIWILALIGVIILGLFVILAMRPTVVNITPHSHAIVFDKSAEFVAFPSDTAASGTLPYTVQTVDLDDSEVIPSQGGTTHTETKASGSVTVYNAYSASSVHLVATTRFETPDHLIFRTPSDVVIPAKKGNTPGSVSVTLIADQAGAQYNIPANTKLTVPGLSKNTAMFGGVYAQASAAMAGGFAGDKVATDPAARATAIAQIRTRLQENGLNKVHDSAGDKGVIFPSLTQVSYQDLPDTTESNGVGVHERIHILAPVIPADVLAHMVAASVTSDADTQSLKLVPGDGYTAISNDAASSTIGTAPFHFMLAGNATLVWDVDTTALAKALAGRDQASFKTIIANFPSIEAAHARIEPFWKKSFPEDPASIKINVSGPSPASDTPKP